MNRWLTGTSILFGALTAPTAQADPSSVPDLRGYRSVDVKDYDSYYTYPTTNGKQFATPAGFRCRITYTGRANVREATCWGRLPGTSFNSVAVQTGVKFDPAAFGNVDLTAMEIYQPPPSFDQPKNPPPQTISPDTYKLLPAGSMLTYPESATCAVTDVTTTCVLGAHGFVLDPNGSRAF
jgi:hypothetical protein